MRHVTRVLVSSYFFKLLTRGRESGADMWQSSKGEVSFLSFSLLNGHVIVIVVVVGVKNHVLRAVGCHFEQKSKCLYMLPYLSVHVIGQSGNAHMVVCLSMEAGSSVT